MTQQQIARTRTFVRWLLGILIAGGLTGSLIVYGQDRERFGTAARKVPVIEERLAEIEKGDIGRDRDIERADDDIRYIRDRVDDIHNFLLGEQPNEQQ